MGVNQFTVPTEKQEAKVLVEMLKWRKIAHWHIPNENSIRSPQYLSCMKAQGWNKGIADYFILIPFMKSKTGKPVGLFVELKRRKPKSQHTGKLLASPSSVSPEQKNFINCVDLIEGVHGAIAYGADEAIEFIDSFVK